MAQNKPLRLQPLHEDEGTSPRGTVLAERKYSVSSRAMSCRHEEKPVR